MNQLEDSIANLKQRIAAMRDGLGEDLNTVLETLEQVHGEVEQRDMGQRDLIDELTEEAGRAEALRAELSERQTEIRRLTSELESKGELVRALRRQLDEASALKSTAKQRDQQLSEQQHALERTQGELDSATMQLSALKVKLDEVVRSTGDDAGSAELESLRNELEARKSVIKSLRADAERAGELRAQLDAKRESITELEDAIDRQTGTIEELRRSVDAWRAKYFAAIGAEDSRPEAEATGIEPADDAGRDEDEIETLANLPTFSNSEIEALQELERTTEDAPVRTIAMDMRDPLQEARRQRSGADA